MAFIIKDRVKEGTSSVGTGVITLSGSVATFTPFNSFMTNGDTTYYAIVHTSSGVNEWEVGLGTWNTGNTLTRTTVLSGSNGTSAVNFSTGTKDVFMTYPASKAVALDASVNLSIPGNLSVTGSVDGVTSIEVDTHLDFQTTTQNKPAHHEGRIFYDAAFGALAVYNDEADITLQVGQEEYIRVKNNTGSTILNGVPIYITGEESSTPTVAVARADGTYNQSQSVGIATHDIETNSIGYITVRGLIADVDTSHLTVGEKVHVAIGASGGTQTASPTYPNYPTEVGICLISASSGGCIYVYTQTEAFESLRVTNNAHFDSDVTIAGDLTILGNQTIASASNVSIANAWNYFNSGDTIGSLNTAFTGSGLDDASLTGHFTGTSTTNYYVRIDSVGGGTGGVDTFEWSTDNFSTFVAQDVDITGTDQLIHSTDNIAINFNATTGHTLGDVWTGSGSPINVDTGFASNRNTGTSGVGYTHVGIYYDVSTNKWTVFDEYSPEPEGTINVGHSSFSYGTFKAGTFEGSLTGNVTGDLTGNSAGQHSGAVVGNVTGNVTGTSGSTTGNAATATTLATARNIQLTGDVTGTASFDGSNNAVITASVQDDSHSHVITNVDGLQTALDSKTPTSRIITAGNGLTGGGNLTANRTFTVGGGTGVTVNANDIAIGQDVATTASPTFAGLTTTANVSFGDNDKAIFGAGSDLRIYHDGSNSYIEEAGVGNLYVKSNVFRVYNAAGNEISANFVQNGAVTLYHDNAAKIATTSTGVDVTGTVTATGGVKVSTAVENGTAQFSILNANTSPASEQFYVGNNLGDVDLGNKRGDLKFFRGTTERMRVTTTGIDVTGNITLTGTVDGRDVAADGTKLNTIETGATADQTAAEILAKVAYLPATDDRDMKPSTSGIGSTIKGIKSFFSSLGGMTGSADTDYQDVIVLDTYPDTTGGKANALVLDKSTHLIKHYQAVQTATTWGTPKTLAYTDQYSVGDGELTEINFTSADHTKLNDIEAGATTDQTAVELLVKIKTVDVNGTAGVNAGTLDGLGSGSFTRLVSSASGTAGTTAGDWVTVASSQSGRHRGEVLVSDSESGDHAFIRIDWLRSYADTTFTVLSCGGHQNRITGVRVLNQTSDITYGWKYLQVYVVASSLYTVQTFIPADISNWTGHAAVTPIVQNTLTGYSVQGAALSGLDTYPLASQQGILAGTDIRAYGNILVGGTVDGRDVSVDGTKLDGIETGATADQTAVQLLTAIKTVDGASSGLDADLLDGLHASSFATSAQGTLATNALPKAGGTMTGGINYNDYFETYSADYSVSTTNRKALLWNGATIPNGGTYRFTAHIATTGTDNSATAVYWNQGGTWKLNVTCQSGTSSNNPEFIIENGVPTLSHDHPANYTVHVYGERMQLKEGTGTDNYNMFGADGFMGSVGNVLRYNPAGSGTTYSTGDVVFHEGNSTAFTSADNAKLVGIETGATADQTFDQLLSKTSGTGEYSTNGNLTSGRGSGGVAMTINDGYGNANLTFNHKQGIPEQLGNGARIVVNTDATSNPNMSFQMGSATTAGVAYATTERMKLQSTGLTVTGTVTATSYAGDGSSLTGIAAGAGGGGNDEIFWENGQNVTTSYTITNGKNAMSAGPITINSGVTVTVGAGETWTVI